MKQKNLAMLGVAVGCGLVAAVAVAKLSAGGPRGPETTKVLVAKKDLPVQTTLDEKEMDNLLGLGRHAQEPGAAGRGARTSSGQGQEPEPDPEAGQPAVDHRPRAARRS